MSTNRWDTLSEWHNEWLDADAAGRDRLRAELAAREPGLLADAEALTSATDRLAGFLETPAFLLAVPDLAAAAASTLDAGTMLGPYRITGPLASGGMGDVYRATDVRLDRHVAVKVLTRANESDPDRRERFLQEARLTAQLDHPNVVRLYDVGIASGRPYLVTELLEGETLRARLDRGPMPGPEAAAIAADIARALVAAHAARLVHRDLKPANVFLARNGVAKVLDFGIAKLNQDVTGPNVAETMTGVLFGTAGYLAPEQVRGLPVDARTDLFTLGAIVFEMLHGRRAFAREHTIDTLHAIVHEPPIEPAEGRANVPAALQAIVSRLLEKAPADRFQTAAEVLEALERVNIPSQVPGRLSSRLRRLAGVAAAAAAVVAGTWLVVARTDFLSRWSSPERSTWTLPAGSTLASPPAISPDGSRVAIAASTNAGSILLVKDMNAHAAQTVAGTEGASQPFWSPDGKSVGYFARGRLMRVELGGGAPVELAAPAAMGGSWSPDGTIVFGRSLIDAPLMKIKVAGGAAEPATTLDRSTGDNSHRWPSFLPDGIHFVFFLRSANDQRRGVYLGRVDKPAESRQLFPSDSNAVYVPLSPERGVLLSERSGRIEAREFDAVRLSIVGDPRFIDLPTGAATPYYSAMLSASPSALAVTTSIPFGDKLMEVHRDGRVLRTWPERELQNWPRVSADGRWLLRQRIDALRGNPDIWAEHLELRTRIRVTTEPDDDALAVWSQSGKDVAYVSGHLGAAQLRVRAADGTGSPRNLSCPAPVCRLTDWTRDGRFLVANINIQDKKDTNVWLVATTPADPSRPLLSQPFVERDARLSPDGRWVAYVSEETGRPEVSVRRIGGPDARVVISADGGDQPVWRRDGSELFFVDPEGRLMAAPMQTSADASPLRGAPAVLPVPPVGFGHFGTQYDVSPDGQRFYYLDRRRDPGPSEIVFVTGWQRQR